ncbi:MAG TPA: 23S rRNA (guanosine(2251)-2'-O)-methyltransferase RlmB [Thermoanaerobaculia bacterium]
MILYGVNPIREAIRAHPARIRYIAVASEHKARLQKLIAEAKEAGVSVRQLSPSQIDRLAGKGIHNGVAAELSPVAYADFDEVVAAGAADFILILDGIQDPQNLGAILRVADSFQVDLVVIPEHESAGLTATVVKASAGASEWVPVAQVTNLSRAIEVLKKAEYWVYGAEMEGDPITKIDFRGKVAVVLGGEGKGMRHNVLEHCDRKIAIPTRGHVESLNVSTAAAIICYEVDRQHRAASQ